MTPLRFRQHLACGPRPLPRWIHCSTTGDVRLSVAESSSTLKTPKVLILSLLFLCCQPSALVFVDDEASDENTLLALRTASEATTISGGVETGASSVIHSAADAVSMRTRVEVNDASKTLASVTASGDANVRGVVEVDAGNTIHGTPQLGETGQSMGALIATDTANTSEGAEVGTGSVSRVAAHTGGKEGATASDNFMGTPENPEDGATRVLRIPPDGQCRTRGPHAHRGCAFPGCTCKWNRSCDRTVALGRCEVAAWFWIAVGILSLGVMGVVAYGVTYIKHRCANLD